MNQSAPSEPAAIPVGPLATEGASDGDATGVGVELGVALGLGVAEAVAVGVAEAAAVGDADAAAVGVAEAVAVGDEAAAAVGVAVGPLVAGPMGAIEVVPAPHASSATATEHVSIARKMVAFIADGSSRNTRSGDRAAQMVRARPSLGVWG